MDTIPVTSKFVLECLRGVQKTKIRVKGWEQFFLEDEIYCIGIKYIYIHICIYMYDVCIVYGIDIQVVPGRAGGGSFRRKKNYIAKKEFAYRMCAR